jgi:ABC-type Mn2+/Zn2+ transport system permease subunit
MTARAILLGIALVALGIALGYAAGLAWGPLRAGAIALFGFGLAGAMFLYGRWQKRREKAQK